MLTFFEYSPCTRSLHAWGSPLWKQQFLKGKRFWKRGGLEKMIPLGFLLKKGAYIQKSHGFYWRSWKETKFVLKTFLWKQQSLKKVLEERKIIPMHFSLKKGFWIQKSHGFCLDDKSFEKKGFVLKTSLWKHQSWTKQKKLFKEKFSMDFYFKERCLEPKIPWFLLRW